MIDIPEARTIRDVAAKAERLYPGVVGEVLGSEIRSCLSLRFLGPVSRSRRLCEVVASMPEPEADR